jgi:dihydroxyacetone kinase-like protein
VPDRIDHDVMSRMLLAAAARIRGETEILSSLDAAIGDGDHGTAMAKVADAITGTIQSRGAWNLAALLTEIGWAAMGTDAGSTGPLYGSLFVGMSEAVGSAGGLDARAIASVLEGGLTNLRRNTRAGPGDKTMIDALLPAVAAIRAAADADRPIAAVLYEGAIAAAAGAEATKPMPAKYGRARNIGARAIGHVDPGAASMSLFFAGLKEGFEDG